MSYMRRLSPLEATYTKERATEVCLETLLAMGFDLTAVPNIKLDLDDRPQKSPRACVIASDPPRVVHLITRAMGGIHDYRRSCTRPATPCTTPASIRRCHSRSAVCRATTA